MYQIIYKSNIKVNHTFIKTTDLELDRAIGGRFHDQRIARLDEVERITHVALFDHRLRCVMNDDYATRKNTIQRKTEVNKNAFRQPTMDQNPYCFAEFTDQQM